MGIALRESAYLRRGDLIGAETDKTVALAPRSSAVVWLV